jgi:hypothetical protein
MKELKARKKALAAESEVYREMLKLEVQNLRIYGIKTKRRLTAFNTSNPLMMLLGIPVAGRLAGGWLRPRRRSASSWKRWVALAVAGWQAYSRFGPVVRSMLARRRHEEYYAAPAPIEEEYPLTKI